MLDILDQSTGTNRKQTRMEAMEMPVAAKAATWADMFDY
jgi:hypothetical protein